MTQRRKKCPICGKELHQPETGRPRVYSSDACRQKAYRQRHGQ